VSLASKGMEKTASVIQTFKPLNKIHEHVQGFHFYSDDLNRQVVAHHYCGHLKEQVRQCVIYDSDADDARLIGVEYIISAELFEKLPEDEKLYWHSHVMEVKSGLLICPTATGVPRTVGDNAEMKYMEELINTYGKTWHFWQVDRGDALPFGPPKLMMSIVEESQVNTKAIEERDAHYKISTAEKKKQREHLKPKRDVDPKADHWVHRNDGKTYRPEMVWGPAKK
jgi:hypothetical protein